MSYIIVGLGNPSGESLKDKVEDYNGTRHNAGRMMLQAIAKEFSFDEFSFDKKSNSDISKGDIKKEKVTLVAPNTYMNNSGKAISYFIKTPKAINNLIVIYDDFNLPLGKVKISFNRSSGGHNGLESIIKSIKSEAFIRIRIGIAPENSKGNAKIPHGDDKIEKFILGKFKPEELKELKKIEKLVIEAIEIIVKEGHDKAASIINGK
jgi:PTH1 family peptidyl-tRNA hydrolase